MRVTATHVQETDGGDDDTTTCVQERASAAGSGYTDARSNMAEIDGASAAQIDREAEVLGLIDHDSRSNFTDDAMKDQATAHHQFSSDDENLEDCMNEENDSVCEVDEQTPTSHNIPKTGMTFKSENEAYDFYNAYAKNVGFSIRKCHGKTRPDKTLCAKYFVCSNEGQKSTHSTHETKKERASTRSSCQAFVRFTISRDGIWTVRKVELGHNHPLVSPDKSHMLRSQRHILEADKLLINKMREAGIRPSEIYDFFEQWCGGDQNVPFLPIDCNNYIGRQRKQYLEANDAQTLLHYLENKQIQDPSFFYAVQLDKEDGRIANFFWADGQSIMDYASFGDVLCLDTTFQTNKCEMPFAPILGTNHHKQTIVFGAALLFDESADSFVWLFRVFLKAMSGKQPNTIFTDQCAAMAKAIRLIFPTSSHRLCLWHIYQNAAKHLSHIIANNSQFLSDFKSCIYEERSVAHFNMKWEQLLDTYKLQDNAWIQNLYLIREKWATIHRRDSFCADMTSTQRSEGMNNVFKKTFRRKLSISELLQQCDRCIARLRRNEAYEDYKSRHTNPNPYVSSLPMLKTAAENYTRNLFSDFEEEFKKQFPLLCELIHQDGPTNTYSVTVFDHNEDEAKVVFNSDNLDSSCSCQMYTCSGILCKHILRIFNYNNIVVLPPKYISSRWTKYAKRGSCSGKTRVSKESLESRCTQISRKTISIALKCKISKEAVDHFENCMDKVASEIDDLLSKVSLDDELPKCTIECTEDVAKTRVSFRAPPHKKGPISKRSKSVLDRGRNTSNKKTRKKGKDVTASDVTASENTQTDGPSQSTEQLQSNACEDNSMQVWTNAMPIEDSSLMFFPDVQSNTCPNNTMPVRTNAMQDSSLMFYPAVQGEFTNLLFQQHPETSGLLSKKKRNIRVDNSTEARF